VTSRASLISPALGKPGPDRTRLLAGAKMNGGKTLPKAWGKSLPKDVTANAKEGGPQGLLTNKTSSTQGGRVGIFFTLNKAN